MRKYTRKNNRNVTKRRKTKRNKTKRNETKQNKTKQHISRGGFFDTIRGLFGTIRLKLPSNNTYFNSSIEINDFRIVTEYNNNENNIVISNKKNIINDIQKENNDINNDINLINILKTIFIKLDYETNSYYETISDYEINKIIENLRYKPIFLKQNVEIKFKNKTNFKGDVIVLVIQNKNNDWYIYPDKGIMTYNKNQYTPIQWNFDYNGGDKQRYTNNNNFYVFNRDYKNDIYFKSFNGIFKKNNLSTSDNCWMFINGLLTYTNETTFNGLFGYYNYYASSSITNNITTITVDC